MKRLALLALCALVLAAAPRPSEAAVPVGGALNPPGERSHTFGIGWPEFFYTWEGLVRDKAAFGVRVGLQVWPLALAVGGQARFVLVEQNLVMPMIEGDEAGGGPVRVRKGKAGFSLSLLVAPAIAFAGYGGTKAVYLQNYGFGRSRTFRASLGPQLNIGLLGSIEVSKRTRILFGWENPVALWVWTRPAGWWLEWPLIFSGGLEYRVTYSWSLFGRLAAGPSIAFAGPTQLLGIHWHIVAGAQIRY